MVLKGQFLERMTMVQSGPLELDGLFHEGTRKPGVVIASPHPSFGGSMDAPVCAELAWAITRRGYASLRFNYRGVGASQGKGHVTQPSAMEEREDLRAAVALMQATTRSERVHVVGYSFGAWLVSHLCTLLPRVVDHVVLVSPPTRLMPFDWETFARSGVPGRIIVGTHDTYTDVPALEETARALNLDCQRIAEADHFFLRGLHQVGTLAAEFLAPHGELLDLPAGEDDEPLELDLPAAKPAPSDPNPDT